MELQLKDCRKEEDERLIGASTIYIDIHSTPHMHARLKLATAALPTGGLRWIAPPVIPPQRSNASKAGKILSQTDDVT
jgi:hypothetical protein